MWFLNCSAYFYWLLKKKKKLCHENFFYFYNSKISQTNNYIIIENIKKKNLVHFLTRRENEASACACIDSQDEAEAIKKRTSEHFIFFPT